MNQRELNPNLERDCESLAKSAACAAKSLALINRSVKDAWLLGAANALREKTETILEVHALDLEAASGLMLSPALIDRLRLDAKRIEAMARTLEQVAALPDPVGEVIRGERRPNGLDVRQVRAPLGVVFMIFESRPNVTIDAAALCLKSGNAAILRGGKEALATNLALLGVLINELPKHGLPEHSLQLVPWIDREAVGYLLERSDLIDLVVPRGGESLIRRVVEEASMPVLKHYKGNCHVYVDASADFAMALKVLVNSKVQRPGVCNAAETLLVHKDAAAEFLPLAAAELQRLGVELRGDSRARDIACSMVPATDDDWDAEFLDLILAVGVVDSLDEAIAHINRHGSKHTDAILTRNVTAARKFVSEVDSAAVIVNASTRFNDGGELGLGAEIGISTDKYHARGPCGLRELTTTKWIVEGDGQVRE